jgi:hypothetical protein
MSEMTEDSREFAELEKVEDDLPQDLNGLLELGKRLRESGPLQDKSATLKAAAHLLKVRDRNGAESELMANAVQALFEERRGQHNIVLKARQMGMTTWVAARFFLKTITAPGVMTVQVAHTREASEGIFRMVQRFWECLPDNLREGPLRLNRKNVGQMRFPELDSEFRIVSAADESAGRGLTIQNLHCSELGRWQGNAAETLAGLRAALVPGGELVMESTPNGAYGCFYDEWMRAGLSGPDGSGVVKHFYPWWMERAYVAANVTNYSDEESKLMLAPTNLTSGQIGFRRGLERSYRGLRSQEFAEDAETCFKATGECCFDVEAIEQRMSALHEPTERRRGGALQIWLPPMAGREYLVSVDTAGGGPDGDFAAMQVIELVTGLQCAELQQRLSPLELAKVAAALAREYSAGSGSEVTIVVERNNHGAAVLAYLDAIEHYRHVWAEDGLAGWLTTAGNKPRMIGNIGALLVQSSAIFASRRLLRECRSFISHAGGSTGAANGAHDDCLMAMAIAQAVRAEWLARRR